MEKVYDSFNNVYISVDPDVTPPILLGCPKISMVVL